ncbi:hypothetical protein SLS63_004509 [Diaporthe eres]|uniref:Uncharacterized protein n=1 Tax=Diaporthe eres TaxID=83184 RepID=A0ABR1PD32_DIAER
MRGKGKGPKERITHYEVPSLEHHESSQRTLVEVSGGAVSVRVNGAVTEFKTPSPKLGGRFSESVGAAGAASSELGPTASDMSDELTGGSGSEEDGGPAGSVSDSEGIGAVDVTGAGGAAKEVEEEEEDKREEEEDSRETVEVGVGSSEEAAEVMGGAPDTAEVLDGDWEADVLELSGLGASDEIKEAVVVAAVAEDGGVCGEPIEGVVRVSEDDGASDVPSGLSGSLVTVTQSVTDTVLLLASWILDAPLSSVE